jgi:hypothetical protein
MYILKHLTELNTRIWHFSVHTHTHTTNPTMKLTPSPKNSYGRLTEFEMAQLMEIKSLFSSVVKQKMIKYTWEIYYAKLTYSILHLLDYWLSFQLNTVLGGGNTYCIVIHTCTSRTCNKTINKFGNAIFNKTLRWYIY